MAVRDRYLAAAAIAALLVVAATDLAIVASRSAKRSVVAVRHRQLVAELPTPTPPATPSPSPSPTHSPRMAAQTLAIPSQHVLASIDVCQIIAGGLEPPANVHRTCYWAGGASVAAAAGTTVLTGHINWVGQGTGAFGNLGRLAPGATVLTSDADRQLTRWRVVAVRHRPKTRGIDPAAFAGRDGPRRLYLISCGGAFDSADLSYVDNIYVLATPLPDAPAAASSAAPPRTS
jgi:hypothetical protein